MMLTFKRARRLARIRPRPEAASKFAVGVCLTLSVGACSADRLTESLGQMGESDSPTAAATIPQPPGQDAARVVLSYSQLVIGPPGARATVGVRAYGADGREWSGVTIRWWKSSTSAFALSVLECATPCSSVLSTRAVAQGKVIVRHYGGVARDTMPVTITAQPNTPGDPPPDDPPPDNPPPDDPPPPPPGSLPDGCPTNYNRLVSVSTSAQLAAAVQSAAPGDLIRVAAGTYTSPPELTRSGTASAPVAVCGTGAPILKQQFRVRANYVVIAGLVFEGPINGSTNQVWIHEAHHVTFTRNEIRGNDYHAGLSVDEANHIVITYNYIHDNGRDTSHDHGIYFKTTTGPGSVISNNLLVRNAARGLSLHDNSGVGVYDVLVTHNTVVGNGSTGILVNDGDRMTLANNISAFNGDKTSQRQIRIRAGNNNRAYNNLTYHPTSSRAGIENTTGSLLSGNRVADPRFVSQFGNLRLQTGSPAIDLGRSEYAAGSDYDGRARGTAPDAGAFEW
jgi:hypothetical protein